MTNQDGFISWEKRPEEGQAIEVLMSSGRIEAATYWGDGGIDGVFETDDGEEVDVTEVKEYASTTMWRAATALPG